MPEQQQIRPDATWVFEAIGTQWQLTLDEAAFTPALTDQISSLIARFDQTWSRFRDDSVINQLRNAPTAVCLPTEADELFRLYAELDELTDGAVNPLVGAGLRVSGTTRVTALSIGKLEFRQRRGGVSCAGTRRCWRYPARWCSTSGRQARDCWSTW